MIRCWLCGYDEVIHRGDCCDKCRDALITAASSANPVPALRVLADRIKVLESEVEEGKR